MVAGRDESLDLDALIDSVEAGGRWWAAAWDRDQQRAEVLVYLEETPLHFRFELDGAQSALFRWDISEQAADLSFASSSPSRGWVSWAHEFVMAVESEMGSQAETLTDITVFEGGECPLDVDDPAAGFAAVAVALLVAVGMIEYDVWREEFLTDS